MHPIAQRLAEALLTIHAVKLSPSKPYIWSSGLRSPIYCDNRLTLSYPEVREMIKAGLSELSRLHFSNADGIAAVATAGIPHGAVLADVLGLPFIYVRSTPKAHGLKNLIEGRVELNKKYLVVEDLISTGASSIAVVNALREEGAEVCGVVSVFTYQFEKAMQAFQQLHTPVHSITNLDILLQRAVEISYIQPAELESIKSWSEDPERWSVAHS